MKPSLAHHAGGDQAWGRGSGDEINNGDGPDIAYGEAGNDVIYGDDHSDSLSGNGDEDNLHGGNAADNIYGNSGNKDQLWGGSGDDFLDTSDDDLHDELDGGGDQDTCKINRVWHIIYQFYEYDDASRCNDFIFQNSNTTP